MSKEVRVCLSLIQIALMLLSVVSFSVILNSGVVSGEVRLEFDPPKLQIKPPSNEKEDDSQLPQPTSTLSLQERLFEFGEGKEAGFLDLTIGGGTALDAVASAASYAAAAYASIRLFTEIFGIEGEKARNIERAAVISIGAGKLTSNIMQRFASESFLQGWGGYAPWAVGAAAFLMTYKKQETKIVKFECKPWEPPCSLLAA